MQEKRIGEVYAEIDKIIPALEYCLAPKKRMDKERRVRTSCLGAGIGARGADGGREEPRRTREVLEGPV